VTLRVEGRRSRRWRMCEPSVLGPSWCRSRDEVRRSEPSIAVRGLRAFLAVTPPPTRRSKFSDEAPQELTRLVREMEFSGCRSLSAGRFG